MMKKKKRNPDEEYIEQDHADSDENGREDPKKRSGRKERLRRKKEQEQIIRIEKLEKIMGEMGEDVDPETIVSMYMPRRKAKKFGAALLRLDKLHLWLLGMLLLVAVLFIVAFMQEKMGNFTINLNRLELFRKGIAIAEDGDFTDPTARLTANTVQDATNITLEDLPKDLDDIDGDHNGRNYMAYTYYVRNAGKEDVGYVAKMIPTGIDSKGKYVGTDGEHYAFLCGEYVLYTITETGTCDVYLSPDDLNKYITVTQTSGEETSTTVPGSIRIGITIQPMKADGTEVDTTQPEKLVLVYAPQNETGKGNDSGAISGWTCVKDTTSLMTVPYTYIYGTETVASDGKTYVATKDEDNYLAPATNGATIATNVGYNGVAMRVYIWLEGTDADCINTNGEEDDMSTYNVTVSLAGVAS